MQVNFNNVRKQALYTYHRLCLKLNDSIEKGIRYPNLIVDPEDIRSEMEQLRMQLWTICLSYKENDPEIIDLSEEIDAGGEIAHFYPEE